MEVSTNVFLANPFFIGESNSRFISLIFVRSQEIQSPGVKRKSGSPTRTPFTRSSPKVTIKRAQNSVGASFKSSRLTSNRSKNPTPSFSNPDRAPGRFPVLHLFARFKAAFLFLSLNKLCIKRLLYIRSIGHFLPRIYMCDSFLRYIICRTRCNHLRYLYCCGNFKRLYAKRRPRYSERFISNDSSQAELRRSLIG